jgi:hypothetical protein
MKAVPIRQFAPKPVFRRLRVFAVDPGVTVRFETAVINEMILSIPWEPLNAGPSGEYIAVTDKDETGKQVFDLVSLDAPEILAQHGLAPSDGNPQFRQQMVFAVAMWTIRNFERALGRITHWPQPGVHRKNGNKSTAGVPAYQRQLQVNPHFRQDLNAYYTPGSGFCFGYGLSPESSPFPGTAVFTCLSQDVIAHELTHALLLGMSIEFQGTNPDVPAFHEAFADLIALFQHFGKSDVLREQIKIVRGNLDARSDLGAVGVQLGQALGKPDGLRNALGFTDPRDGTWHPRRPDPTAYKTETQPHARGDILVGAVFEAFRKIYESRVADLRRIASKGTGILPEGSLHPDLVERFANEASKIARQVLDMCIRALDYIPPVEITFGDFLRALITADYDLDPFDDHHYRVAFVDAFRSYGIFPPQVGTLSVETLMWAAPSEKERGIVQEFVNTLSKKHNYWSLPRDRELLWNTLEEWRGELTDFLKQSAATGSKRLGSVDLTKSFTVLSFNPRARTDAARDLSTQWVIKVVQEPKRGAGCTLLVDAGSGLVRYMIDKQQPKPKKAQQPADDFDLLAATSSRTNMQPVHRKLRVFAFDPSLGIQLETAGINEVTLRVAWEENLKPGPIGEYLEIVDRDPPSARSYIPVDLNDAHILAQDGLAPSESNPQAHQQMVYAVAMRTIENFERSLGRRALWSSRFSKEEPDGYVGKLRIYPHALREANAYYSPEKKAILFGYFPSALPGDAGSGLTVFTCLSHDIIAHEVTHALLDGMHHRFNEASNPDVLAFHEAFADLVALFQHFSLPDVLRHQIAATRGDLESQSRLGELAQQFGQATGKREALRSAIGKVDPKTDKWVRLKPNPEAYRRETEPHARGAILVAAIFDAFLTIYKSRIADLLRIATEGTGVLPEGHLHPDLVNRLAFEAAESAQSVLNMCIQALDYCPPVDITFGDYLRAIMTADFENDPIDETHRRAAFVEAFRAHGIVPDDVRTLSVDGLLWRPATDAPAENEDVVLSIIKSWAPDVAYWGLSKSREGVFKLMIKRRAELHGYLKNKLKSSALQLSSIDNGLPVEVHVLRPSIRTDWEGRPRFQWIIELTQRIPEYLDPNDETVKDRTPDYYFRGGCTLLVDAETGKIRYTINKKLDKSRREQQRRYVLDEGNQSLAATYLGGVTNPDNEPFAMLHRF